MQFRQLVIPTVALLFVSCIFMFTNRIPAAWDTLAYLDISLNGLAGNDDLAAPFAYRFGVPLLFGEIAQLTGFGIETVYRGGAFVASLLFFVLLFRIAEKGAHSAFPALAAAVLVSSGFWHIKFVAFFDTMIDIYAAVILCLGWYLILSGRLALAGGLAVLGLFVKEWPGVLLALVVVAAVGRAVRDQRKSDFVMAAALVLAGLAAIVLPRMMIEVAESVQFIDPLNDRDWFAKLVGVLGYRGRLFNLGVATLSYWLPLFLLLTRQRLAVLHAGLRASSLRGLCALHVFLVSLLALYGGTNLNIFVSYSAPVLALCLGIVLAHGSVRPLEFGAMALVVLLFNRLFFDIPDPRIDVQAYLNYVPPYDGRINAALFMRTLEAVGAIVIFRLVFSLPRFSSPPQVPDLPRQ